MALESREVSSGRSPSPGAVVVEVCQRPTTGRRASLPGRKAERAA